jgi:glyoxylase-like metal-dependent hydrolase (beta-lactamase superfamily II)
MLLIPVTPSAQNQTMEWVTLADGVYAAIYSEFRMDPIEGNSLLLIGPDDVIVVDSGRTPAAASGIINRIRALTAKPVRWVINTHWHDDHIFGNQAYEAAFPGVQFLAHRATREDLLKESVPTLEKYGPPYWDKMAAGFEDRLAKGTTPQGTPYTRAQIDRLRAQAKAVRDFIPKLEGIRVVLPTVAIEGDVVLHQGSREVRVLYQGPGNTKGDLAVFLPQEGILATGDLLVHPIPFAYGASISDWSAALRRLRSLEARTIVPGHGPVMNDFAYLDSVTELFDTLVRDVRAAKAQGLSLQETRKLVTLSTFMDRFAGADGFRRATFADSILRVALEQVFTTTK